MAFAARSERCLLVVVAGLVGLATSASSDLDDGHAALAAHDYATARAEFAPLAEAGNLDAQYNLGVLYLRGLGTPKDVEQAIHWFTEAARGHSAQAAYALGLIYGKGSSVEFDPVEAYAWFRVASLWGSREARTDLYRLGRAMGEQQVETARERADELAAIAEDGG